MCVSVYATRVRVCVYLGYTHVTAFSARVLGLNTCVSMRESEYVKSKTRFKRHVLHQRTTWITPRPVDMKLHSKWSKVQERGDLSRLILAGITASVHWNGTG